MKSNKTKTIKLAHIWTEAEKEKMRQIKLNNPSKTLFKKGHIVTDEVRNKLSRSRRIYNG